MLKLRICWIALGSEEYGVGRAITTLLMSMKLRGHICSLIVLSEGALAVELRKLDVPVYVLNIPTPPSYAGSPASVATSLVQSLRQAIAYSIPLRRLILSIDPHFVHIQWPSQLLLCGMATSGTRSRCIWEMPNAIGARKVAFNRMLYQIVCGRYRVIVLANSAYTASTMGSLFVTPIVFHLGVDADQFRQQSNGGARASLGIPKDGIVLGAVSRLHSSKGLHFVIGAMGSLVAKGADLQLVVVGGPLSGAYWEQLNEQIWASKLTSRVHFTGQLPNTSVVYPAFDIFLQTRIDPEPFGLSAVEALMCGVPVLAHALGGPAETVVPDVTGWHYTDNTEKGLETAISCALEAKGRWPQMQAAARADAELRFSAPMQAERYERILASAIAR